MTLYHIYKNRFDIVLTMRRDYFQKKTTKIELICWVSKIDMCWNKNVGNVHLQPNYRGRRNTNNLSSTTFFKASVTFVWKWCMKIDSNVLEYEWHCVVWCPDNEGSKILCDLIALPCRLHGLTSQMTAVFIITALITSYFTVLM